MQTFAAVWGFWPLILVGALQGSLKRSRKGKLGESILFNLLVAWGVFALLWLVATLSGYPPQGYFLSTEVNNGLFWTFGLILGVVKLSAMLKLGTRPSVGHSVAELQALSPAEFEEFVADAYRGLGYQVKLVGAQGDHGIDLILTSADGSKQVVQCKRWKAKVGEPVVRDFFGAMQHEGAIGGVVISLGGFTQQAMDWAKGKPVRLYDGEKFLDIVSRSQNKPERSAASGAVVPPKQDQAPTTAVSSQPLANQPPACPKCGSVMVLRTARQGPNQGQQFYGCSQYPQCRGIRPVVQQSKNV